MARQQIKQPESKRNDKIEVVLNPEEKGKILRLAQEEGLPVSTFIRWKLLKK